MPEADVHIAVFHSDFTLFKGLTKAIRTLTGQKILDFGIFFGSQFFVKLNSDTSIQDSIHILCAEMNLFQLCHRRIRTVKVFGEVFRITGFFFLDQIADFIFIHRKIAAVVFIRVIFEITVIVSEINHRCQRTVVMFSNILFSTLHHQLTEFLKRTNLVLKYGFHNVLFVGIGHILIHFAEAVDQGKCVFRRNDRSELLSKLAFSEDFHFDRDIFFIHTFDFMRGCTDSDRGKVFRHRHSPAREFQDECVVFVFNDCV